MYSSTSAISPALPLPVLPSQSASTSANKRIYGTNSTFDANKLVSLVGNIHDGTNAPMLTPDDNSVIKFLKDPYNADFWDTTLTNLFTFQINDSIRQVYEACLRLFPLSVKCWKMYISHESKYSQFDNMKGLFERCLPYVLHLDIYTLYMDYIQTIHRMNGPIDVC
jgi:hypothetical protein